MPDIETWTKRVQEWRTSGLTAEEFCAQRELKRSALYWWSSRLKAEAKSAVRLARLVPRRVERPLPRTDVSTGILIEYEGARLTVGSAVDEATLSRVLDVLELRARRPAR